MGDMTVWETIYGILYFIFVGELRFATRPFSFLFTLSPLKWLDRLPEMEIDLKLPALCSAL